GADQHGADRDGPVQFFRTVILAPTALTLMPASSWTGRGTCTARPTAAAAIITGPCSSWRRAARGGPRRSFTPCVGPIVAAADRQFGERLGSFGLGRQVRRDRRLQHDNGCQYQREGELYNAVRTGRGSRDGRPGGYDSTASLDHRAQSVTI